MDSQKWQKLSLAQQMGNIGAEVNRIIHWQEKESPENKEKALFRALELIDLTIADKRWQKDLLELCRLREVLCDLSFGQNNYNTSPQSLQNYFLPFALLANKN